MKQLLSVLSLKLQYMPLVHDQLSDQYLQCFVNLFNEIQDSTSYRERVGGQGLDVGFVLLKVKFYRSLYIC